MLQTTGVTREPPLQGKLQPNSHSCFVCGLANPFGLKLRFYTQADGEVIADIIIPEQFQGYPGVVHGGVVAAILDEAAGRSHMVEYTLGGESRTRFMLTARMELRYRQNAPVGQPLRLVGRAGKSKGRTAQASAYLYDQSGSLLAEAEAVLVDLPDDVLPSGGLESLGWKVYPEAGVET